MGVNDVKGTPTEKLGGYRTTLKRMVREGHSREI